MILYTEKCGYSMYGSLFLFDMLLILANICPMHIAKVLLHSF